MDIILDTQFFYVFDKLIYKEKKEKATSSFVKKGNNVKKC